jgi:hypothetical protein
LYYFLFIFDYSANVYIFIFFLPRCQVDPTCQVFLLQRKYLPLYFSDSLAGGPHLSGLSSPASTVPSPDLDRNRRLPALQVLLDLEATEEDGGGDGSL